MSCAGVSQSAQPFLAVLLQKISSKRPIVVVTEGLKTQESFQEDIETWLGQVRSEKSEVRDEKLLTSGFSFRPLFYPAWEIFPHEGKLPHADVISERLETLVALSDNSKLKTKNSKLVVTGAAALLQKTFSAKILRERTRATKHTCNNAVQWVLGNGMKDTRKDYNLDKRMRKNGKEE